jgi:tetratricopeptide (TPR) repeat protein
MSARMLNNQKKLALFKYYRGRNEYDQMKFEKALEVFLKCEEHFSSFDKKNYFEKEKSEINRLSDLLISKKSNTKKLIEWTKKEQAIINKQGNTVDIRQENLLYISFCYRHLNRQKESENYMSKALNLRKPGQWILLGRVLANAGALYLHSDLKWTRFYWKRGFDLMKQVNCPTYHAEFAINVGHMDILRKDYNGAVKYLTEGKKIAEINHLHGQRIRYLIQMGCLLISKNEFDESMIYLKKALSECQERGYFRRLWRIRANMATVYEASGDIKKSAWLDEKVILRMAPISRMKMNGEEEIFWNITRASCALGNIALRTHSHPKTYSDVFKLLSRSQRDVAELIANAVLNGDGAAKLEGIYEFLDEIEGFPRFLITD